MQKIPDMLLRMSAGIEKLLEAAETPDARAEIARLQVKLSQSEDLIKDLSRILQNTSIGTAERVYLALERLNNEIDDDIPF